MKTVTPVDPLGVRIVLHPQGRTEKCKLGKAIVSDGEKTKDGTTRQTNKVL